MKAASRVPDKMKMYAQTQLNTCASISNKLKHAPCTADDEHMQLDIEMAYNCRHSKGMVIVDECDLERCVLVEHYLKELGWMTMLKDRQLFMLPGKTTINFHIYDGSAFVRGPR